MAIQIEYPTSQPFKSQTRQLNKQFEVSIIYEKADQADYIFEEAFMEIKRIERLFSAQEGISSVDQINKLAGIRPEIVDIEIYQLIERSLMVSHFTQRAFDITVGLFDNKMSSINKITQLIQRKFNVSSYSFNYLNVVLNREIHSVFLTKPGMRIELDGIIKGYMVECIKRKLIESGVNAGMINASGTLCTWGHSHLGKPWKEGVADSTNRINIFSELELSNKSFTTLGNPELIPILYGGKNSNFTNPVVQYSSKGILSVSIISDDAVLSNALTSPVMTLGIKKGIEMINQMKDIDCIIIDEHHSIFTSNNIRLK